MKYWLLVAACVASALGLLAATHLAPHVAHLGLFACYGLTGVAAVVTALSYTAHDRLRWAWLAFGIGYLVAFGSKVFIGDGFTITQMSPARMVAWSIVVTVFNVALVTAFALFARAWDGTGVAPAWRGRATVIFFVIAFAVDAKSLLAGGRAMIGGQPWAFGFVASVVSDIAVLTLVGPIFATAIALRGGLLMRPWLFLFVASTCWLAVDVLAVLPLELRRDPDMIMRPLAVLFGGAAAIAQLLVKRDVRASLADT
ncbi:MAG TPA: hypothetical protein VGL86_23920 [Polyangia bacterium]|jgi:hypothetical protein